MSSVANVQLLGGVEPVLVGRSIRTASGFPQTMGKNGYVFVSKAGGSATNRNRMRVIRMLVSLLGMFKSLAGALMTGLMVLLFVGLRSNKMGVRSALVQLHGPLMMLVA